MRALFEVNVLIALLQSDHLHHHKVHQWWENHQQDGWATCPITENGFVRILSQPKYPLSQTIQTAIKLLNTAKTNTDHEFWPDSLSISDSFHFVQEKLSHHGQLTDTYLLALAMKNNGKLVTLDRDILGATVSNFDGRHLLVL